MEFPTEETMITELVRVGLVKKGMALDAAKTLATSKTAQAVLAVKNGKTAGKTGPEAIQAFVQTLL